jgi:DNA-binding response OmpR family regulator
VIEDDSDLLEIAVDYLHAKGYSAWGCESAEAFYRRFAVEPAEVVLLDIGLPGEDDLSVARHLRTLTNLKIIMISSRGEEAQRRAGLATGADRYLIKPVILDELAAIIEAVCLPSAKAQGNAQPRASGIWQLQLESWRLIAPSGLSMTLTAREFALIKCLIAADGKMVSKEVVCECVCAPGAPNRNERLDVLLARLRKKGLEQLGIALPIRTAYLIGYVFSVPAMLD